MVFLAVRCFIYRHAVSAVSFFSGRRFLVEPFQSMKQIALATVCPARQAVHNLISFKSRRSLLPTARPERSDAYRATGSLFVIMWIQSPSNRWKRQFTACRKLMHNKLWPV